MLWNPVSSFSLWPYAIHTPRNSSEMHREQQLGCILLMLINASNHKMFTQYIHPCAILNSLRHQFIRRWFIISLIHKYCASYFIFLSFFILILIYSASVKKGNWKCVQCVWDGSNKAINSFFEKQIRNEYSCSRCACEWFCGHNATANAFHSVYSPPISFKDCDNLSSSTLFFY